MKILFSIIVMFATAFIVMTSTASAQYASTGPPPDIHMTIRSDSYGYSLNDTVDISGTVDRVLLDQNNHVMKIEIYNPDNVLFKSDQVNISQNGTYSYLFKINGPLGISGWYNVKIMPIPQEEVGIGFMYGSSPYYLTVGNKTFPIVYSVDNGKINSILVNPHDDSLTFQVSNVRFLTIKMQRDLLDSKDDKNNDIPFLVFTNYTKTYSEETNSNNYSRILKIQVPPLPQGYNILERNNAAIEIIGTTLAPQVYQSLISYHVESPLLQAKAGIPIKEIECADGLELVVKSDGNTPACVMPGTVGSLLLRGWTTINGLPSNIICNQDCKNMVEKAGYFCNGQSDGSVSCYVQNLANVTKVIIAKGASNPQNHATYLPNDIAVVLGVNSTVQWYNQDISPSSVTDNWKKFDSKSIMPNDTWTYVFDRPGVYQYHSNTQPWMHGKVVVLPQDILFSQPIHPGVS